jgi:hypothetical protein
MDWMSRIQPGDHEDAMRILAESAKYQLPRTPYQRKRTKEGLKLVGRRGDAPVQVTRETGNEITLVRCHY